MARTVIKGGTVVTANATTPSDVLIDGESVVALAAAGSHDWEASADKVIDASGKYVIPGGIDVHTHMELPFGGTRAADTFETGTRAAARDHHDHRLCGADQGPEPHGRVRGLDGQGGRQLRHRLRVPSDSR